RLFFRFFRSRRPARRRGRSVLQRQHAGRPGDRRPPARGDRAMTQRVFGVAGWKNSGKTTMTERLVAELSGRGWTVATVKHAHHDADVDHEGTDSFRHRSAGAREVALVTGRRWALMHELRDEPEPSLGDIL